MAVNTGNHLCTFNGLLNLMPMRNTTKSPSISAVKRPGCTLTCNSLRVRSPPPEGSPRGWRGVHTRSEPTDRQFFLGSRYRERITVVRPAPLRTDDRPGTPDLLRRRRQLRAG